MNRAAKLLTLVMVALFASEASCADVVTRRLSDGRTTTSEGLVEDYTGRLLTMRTTGGVLQGIESHDVVEFRTTWSRVKMDADKAFAAAKWREAERLYAEANRSEQRAWARRIILEQWMQCYRAMGRYSEAGDVFLAIVASDPTTVAYRYAPLQWTTDDAAPAEKAAQWFGRKGEPAAVLLGASHLLATSRRQDAIRALQQLQSSSGKQHPRLAALVEAQLWRAAKPNVGVSDVERWAARIEQMPDDVRAGPHFLVAQAYRRVGRLDEAALHYLRPALLFPEERRLAARSLDAAARSLAEAGRSAEAKQLVAELLQRYPDSVEATTVQRNQE